jgi:hypothetical protein
MAEEKILPNADDGAGLSRRQFFVKLGLTSITVAGFGTAVFAYQFLSPNVLYEPSPVVNAGKQFRHAGSKGRDLPGPRH